MALRLAGEALDILGVGNSGYLREIAAADALPGLKVNQTGTGRIVEFQDGGTNKLHILDGGRVVVADSVEIGANPATNGEIRLPNGGEVNWRNAANTANFTGIRINSSNDLQIGVAGAFGNLQLGNSGMTGWYDFSAAGMLARRTSVSANLTLTARHFYLYCDASGGAFTVTLPAPVDGAMYAIKKVDSSTNAVTVSRSGSALIDGATTYTLASQWKYVWLICTNTDWHVIANN
ncbi:MAG: hypothetical protein HYY31_02075 [Chloroflexi bacterium]|nr:hypothetical protein [Chloroflexota bacterium]